MELFERPVHQKKKLNQWNVCNIYRVLTLVHLNFRMTQNTMKAIKLFIIHHKPYLTHLAGYTERDEFFV